MKIPSLYEPNVYIGIEWEVQLTLLDYPQCCVRVLYGEGVEQPTAYHSQKERMVYLTFPYSYAQEYLTDPVCLNLELLSVPASLTGLPAECRAATTRLARVLKEIATRYGPVGAFWPRDRHQEGTRQPYYLSKHVNISRTPEWVDEKERGFSRHLWEEQVAIRFHMCVGYRARDYPALFEQFTGMSFLHHVNWPFRNAYKQAVYGISSAEKDMGPTLLGYCYPDGNPIMLRGLF